MPKFLVFIVALIFQISTEAQILVPKKDYVPEIRQARYSFAFSLITGPNSKLITFGIMRENPDSTREMLYLTKDALIRQASGLEVSRANPDGLDLFSENNIDPKILEDLWKLKYDKKPYEKEEILGWGTKNGIPSKQQFEILAKFGVTKKADYFFGDNFWLLLKKMGDPSWKGNYLSNR